MQPKPGVSLAPLQAQLHEALKSVNGTTRSLAGLQREGSVLLDIIGWTNREAHDKAPETIQARTPELADFFTGIETMHVFELFEVIR